MTAALASAAHAAPAREFYLIALVVVLPPAAWLWLKLGDLAPVALGLAVAVTVIWLGPLVPRSPLACTRPGGHCSQSQDPWVLGLTVVLPLAVVVAYKIARGDKRGSNGSRLP